MATQRVIVVLIACLTLAVLTGGSQSPQRTHPRTGFDLKSLRDRIDAEGIEGMRKEIADQLLQRRISNYEYHMANIWQALMNELRVSEGQWRIIKPKYMREIQLMSDVCSRARHSSRNGKSSLIKPTEDDGLRPVPKTEAELTEAERSVCKLVDLLRREDSTDVEMRKEIDALQQAREKARRERPQARRELAAALTTPRRKRYSFC